MNAEEVRALRKELGCTARELAAALGVPGETVTGWEQGETFPTKQWVEKLEALRARGPGAVPRRARKGGGTQVPALADPEFWSAFRKILAYAELRKDVLRLAEGYPDPEA